jgi:tetratricopeptide (TPR) repeat protein
MAQRSGMFRHYIQFFTISCLLGTGALHGQPASIKDVFHYIEIEQPSRASNILDQLVSAEKKTPDQQYLIGLGYLRLGELDNAIAAFDQGISIKEKYGLNYAGKAHAKILQGKHEEATILLQKALDMSRSKNATILTAVSAAYLADSAKVADAIKLLNKAKSIDTGNPETYILLGDAHLKMNNGGEGVNNYERAAKADPSWATPYFRIAMTFERAKNRAMVLESLNKAISIDSQFAPAYRKLGEIYYAQKQADKAVNAYERYLAITENPGDAKYQYAFFLIMARQFDKANKIFEEVIHTRNVPTIALKYYAFSLLEQDTARKNAEQAKPLLEKYLTTLKPEQIQASDYAYYGKLLLKLDEDSLANQNFAKSLELDSAQQDVMRIYGRNLFTVRHFDQAADVYKRLVVLDESPSLQDLWYLGQAYYYSEQYSMADSTFNNIMTRQSIEKLPYQVLLFSARAKANIDSAMVSGLAKPMYEALLGRVSKNVSKYEAEAIEAYTYLGAYYIHKEENLPKATNCYEMILKLDSTNPNAKEFMQAISAESRQKGG